MYSSGRVVRHLCQRCSKTLVQLRSFHSVSEARDYHKTTSLLDNSSDNKHQSEIAWLPYLTSSRDLNLQETFNNISVHEDKSRALHILLTQQFHQRSWEKLREYISDAVRDDPNNSSNHLAGLLTYFSLCDVLKRKRPLQQVREMQEKKQFDLQQFPLHSNLDKISVAYYWMRNNRLDFANSVLDDITLVEELDCFLVLKGLILFDLNASFSKMVIRDLIKFPDTSKLAAKLALFQPGKFEIVFDLLLRDKHAASDRITEFVEHLGKVCTSYEQIHHILCQIQLPEENMVQVCLNLHQSGSDRLFYTTFLTLSKSATLDLVPLISGQSSSSSTQTHFLHTILAFIRLEMQDLVPLLINKISSSKFANVKNKKGIAKDSWIMQVLNLEGVSLKAADYDALITPLISTTRADLLRKCCDEGTNHAFIKQTVLNSYEAGSLKEVMLFVLQKGKNLSAADYVDDCLLHSCSSLSGGEILSLIRELADHSIVNSYQQKFWMIVAYDRKENGEELAIEMLQEVYGEDSVYFSTHDLNNLMQLVSSERLREELQLRADTLSSKIEHFEIEVLDKKNIAKLLDGSATGDLCFQLLKVNDLLYKIASTFGIHAMMATLQTVTVVGKNCNDLVELMKQIETNNDDEMLQSFLTYYGFLLPLRLKSYGESKLAKAQKFKKSSYEKVTEMQLYLYSYLTHMSINENVLAALQKRLTKYEIAHILMAQYILDTKADTEETDFVMELLNSRKYQKYLSKEDKELLELLSSPDADVFDDSVMDECLMESDEEDDYPVHDSLHKF